MNFYQIIAQNFQTSIERIALCVDEVAEPLERSTHMIKAALLNDCKIISCGNGPDAALSQLFTSTLISRLEHERPALPALSLSSDAANLTAISVSSGLNELYSRQVRAIGQEGDILLCISSGAGHNSLIRAVQAAHERNMTVIALSNSSDTELTRLITSEDIEIRVTAPRRPTVIEIQTMLLNSLCELIDRSLFDSYTRES